MKIDDQTGLQAQQPEVGEHLGVDYSMQLLDCLDLDEDLPFDDEVGAEPSLHRHMLVLQGDGELALKGQACLVELTSQARLVCGLQQAGAELPVNLDGSPDDASADVLGARRAE